jgi:hypothetical protein
MGVEKECGCGCNTEWDRMGIQSGVRIQECKADESGMLKSLEAEGQDGMEITCCETVDTCSNQYMKRYKKP